MLKKKRERSKGGGEDGKKKGRTEEWDTVTESVKTRVYVYSKNKSINIS